MDEVFVFSYDIMFGIECYHVGAVVIIFVVVYHEEIVCSHNIVTNPGHVFTLRA